MLSPAKLEKVRVEQYFNPRGIFLKVVKAGEYLVEMPDEYDPAKVTSDDLANDPALRIVRAL